MGSNIDLSKTKFHPPDMDDFELGIFYNTQAAHEVSMKPVIPDVDGIGRMLLMLAANQRLEPAYQG